MKNLRIFLLLLLAFPLLASAQKLEVSGGYTHTSGDGGLDGFNIGAAAWMTNRVSLAVNYDSGWDTSHLGSVRVDSNRRSHYEKSLAKFSGRPPYLFPRYAKSQGEPPCTPLAFRGSTTRPVPSEFVN